MDGAEIIVLNIIESQSLKGIRERKIKSQLRNKLEEEGRAAFDKISKMFE